ncbi:MAG: hypothetical protein ACI8P0_002048 [Planctomycetaceae bacterium]
MGSHDSVIGTVSNRVEGDATSVAGHLPGIDPEPPPSTGYWLEKAPVSNSETENGQNILLFPRARFSEGQSGLEEFAIGPLRVLPDTDEVWQREFGQTRPESLKVYRDFPDLPDSAEGPEARGSIVTFEDDLYWKHVHRLVGVLFYLGLHTNNWLVPSESLCYLAFSLHGPGEDIVPLPTKTVINYEDHGSIRLLPPLELRGVGKTFILSLELDAHQTLISKLFANLEDRLVTACYHLYRTQWGNFIYSPWEQDCAAYCACLEAAIAVKEGGYINQIHNGLRDRYGEYPELLDWVTGLYVERAVFNHGVSEGIDASSTDNRVQALLKFRKQPRNWTVLRDVCRDVIDRELAPYPENDFTFLLLENNHTAKLLRHLMSSGSVWSEVKRYFKKTGIIEKIRTMADDKAGDLVTLACKFANAHSWKMMASGVDQVQLFKLLKAAAAAMGQRAQDTGDNHADTLWSELYHATCDEEPMRVHAWFVARKRQGMDNILPKGVNDAVLVIAVHAAEYF